MKKFHTDFPPAIFSVIAVAAVVMLFVPFMLVVFAAEDCPQETKNAAGVAVFIGIIVESVYLLMYYSVKTVVCFGKGSIIRCRWLCFRWYIDLEKTKYVVYTIEPHRVRGGTFHTLNVEFAFDGEYGEDRKYLKVKLDSEQIAECMHGGMDKLPIMYLYRYIEEKYPEKAKGFEKCV